LIRLDAHDDAVAVHGVIQMLARDVDVAARIERALRGEQSRTGVVRLQASNVEVHLLGRSDRCPRI